MKINKNQKEIKIWIEQEKLILQNLINHHQANVFALYHLGAYHFSLKDWWNLWKIKRYIKRLNKLEKELWNNNK